MDGLFHGKLIKMDDLGVCTPIFGNIQLFMIQTYSVFTVHRTMLHFFLHLNLNILCILNMM